MGLAPDEVDYYEDDEKQVVRVRNNSKFVPDIDYYEDKHRVIVRVNNRKVYETKSATNRENPKKIGFFQKMIQLGD